MDLKAKVTTPSRPVSPTKSVITARLNTNSTPNFRPKAKVNSSATTRKAVVTKSASASPSASSTPRSRSPAKLTRIRNPTPTHTQKAPSYSGSTSTIRSPALSAPVTPELRTRSLTTPAERGPGGGSSLHHALSFASLQPKVVRDLTAEIYALGATPLDREMTGSPTLRIRSKVSSSVLSASPTHPSTRSPNIFTHTSRSPSVSSPVSQQQQPTSPPPQFYPITTATPAANPHRYASTRPPAPHRTIVPAASQVFQNAGSSPPTTNDASPPSRSRGTIQAKVDPSIVPLPPTSPPMSALSFSSRSSLSRSSASLPVGGVDDVPSPSQSTSTSTASSRPAIKNGTTHHTLTTTLNNLLQYASSGNLPSADDSTSDDDGDDDDRDEEHKVRAAAKSNRKIADLEITNRSLLAINATLEATKHRQAKEIRELKRKLRESRLILPPRAYQAFKHSGAPLEHKGWEAAGDDDDDEDGDDDEGDVDDEENKNDEIYQRIKMLVDNLLKSGQRALEKQIQDFQEGGKGGAKVLTAEEVRDWHQSTHTSGDDLHDNLGNEHDDDVGFDDDSLIPVATTSFEERTMGNNSLTISEAEVEAMTIPSDIYSPSSPPPIFITKPS